jgi:hypothetical protein
MSTAFHCDATGCDTWVRENALPDDAGFLTVDWGSRILHFCSWDCTLKFGAAITPNWTMEARP